MGDDIELIVGRLAKSHGLRGEMVIDVRTDSPEQRFVPGAEFRGRRGREQTSFTLLKTRWHSGRLLGTFEELTDRTSADLVRGYVLYVAVSAEESPTDPDEFYDHQLVGLQVVDQHGASHGEVVRVTHGAQDLLHVQTPHGEMLIPFVRTLVPVVDLAKGHLVVADRPGLLTPLESE
jgi:16S rRNA processing protein RimM